MKGSDILYASGRVCGEVEFGRTHGTSSEACSFRVDIGIKKPVYVRVNVYGGNVEVIRRRNLLEGDYVIICGEMMSRQSEDRLLTEVRCGNIVIASDEGAKATNRWIGSGNVASIDRGVTGSGEEARSLKVVVERRHACLYLRANAFDSVARSVDDAGIGVGDYVLIEGEVMNRKVQDRWLSEIRCQDITLVRRSLNGQA